MAWPVRNGIFFATAYYSLCSSTLLIVNKVAIHLVPAPVSLLSLQLWFAVALVSALAACHLLTIERPQRAALLRFAPVVICFLVTLYANAKVLQFSNVETFITFRASTPLVLCFCDWVFLGRQLPSFRSLLCLLGLLLSTAGYAIFDRAFDVRAYAWLCVWYVAFVAHELFVKHLCDTVTLDNWTRVWYTNAMAGVMLSLAVPFASAEHAVISDITWTPLISCILFVSCLIGIGVSHSAYVMRSACSATLSAVVGIVCKVFTVLINLCMWENHASATGIAFLAIGLVSAAFYQQAPLRIADASDAATSDLVLMNKRDVADGGSNDECKN